MRIHEDQIEMIGVILVLLGGLFYKQVRTGLWFMGWVASGLLGRKSEGGEQEPDQGEEGQ